MISKPKIPRIIWRYYDHLLAGHPGWKEIYREIHQWFFWKGMKNDMRLYVKLCHICACVKPLNARSEDPVSCRKPLQPWEVINVHPMGPYPRTTRGNTICIAPTVFVFFVFVVLMLFFSLLRATFYYRTTHRILNLCRSCHTCVVDWSSPNSVAQNVRKINTDALQAV